MDLKRLPLFLASCIIIFMAAAPVFAAEQVRSDGCQCTDYVYNQRPDIPLSMGHAKQWIQSARALRLPYDQVPQVNDVAVIINGEFGFSEEFGHVAMVTSVNEEHSRFTIAGWDGLEDDCALHTYADLPITVNTFFIHQRHPRFDWDEAGSEWPSTFENILR